MSVINPLAAIVPVAPTTAWQPQREGREHDLRLEQIVRASVAEGGQERVLLEMGQRRFWAETATPLETGQALSLQVVALAPRLALKVVEDPVAERLGRLLHLLGGKWELAAVLTELAGGELPAAGAAAAGHPVFGPLLRLLPSDLESLSGDLLQRLFRALVPAAGGYAEADAPGGVLALHDALRATQRQLATAGDPQGEEVFHLQQQVELALLCHARLAQAGVTFLPLPLPPFANAYLLAERRQASGEKEAQTSLSLHLSLSGLGDLQIDFLHEAQGLSLRFCCSSREVSARLAACHEELKVRFETYPLRGVAFVDGAKSPVHTLLRRLFPERQGVLNTRV